MNMKKLMNSEEGRVSVVPGLVLGLFVVLVLSMLSSCENFQLPQTYQRSPCSDTTDTTSKFALVFTSPHEVEVFAGTKQQFWPEVDEISCKEVSYRLSKSVGSVDANGLYTAPSSVGPAGDTVFLYVQSWAKRSLIDTVSIFLHPTDTSPCDVSSVKYSADIFPILDASCLSCHSTARYLRSGGGVNLDSVSNLKPYVLNGLLLRSIDYSGNFKMPRQAARLDTCSILKIKKWINDGAQDN